MFRRNEATIAIEGEITRTLDRMHAMTPGSQEYQESTKQLKKLIKLKDNNRRKPISTDTAALILANLVGIIIIVAYEQKHVLNPKAWNHTMKPK